MVLLGRNTSTSSHKQTSLFDIRLKGTEHDVLIIKGPPNEASSVLLSGTVVLSVLEPMSIKKLSLKLYATLRLKWTNSFETATGRKINKPFRYEKKVFEHNWDNFEIQDYLSNLYDNYSNKNPLQSKSGSANSSNSSLKSFGKRSKSASNLASFGSSASLSGQSQNHILLQGNYEFPFSVILPGDTLESVEGLPGASLVYKLQATIERGRFANDLTAKKHVRVVRTLTPDAVELSETMAVDNTWPKKVEYTISVPSKAIAIGSATPIYMLLVPLAKGLKIGKVRVALVEYSSCAGAFGPSHSGERQITQITVPEFSIEVSEDRWEVNATLPIPPSLSKCTQDVDVLNNIKVRHKLKFVIGLVNPDGHVSQLRATLPVALFISPFVALGVKKFDRGDSIVDNSLSAFNEIPIEGVEQDDDDVIFSADPELTSPSPVESAQDLSALDREAPPNYGSHIYDRLWSEIPVEDTPDASRSQTPVPGTPVTTQDEGLNVGRLTENLRRLHMQQRLSEQSQNSLDSLALAAGGTTEQTQAQAQTHEDHDDDDDDNDGLSFQVGGSRPPMFAPTPTNEVGASEQDYFAMRPNASGIMSPGVMSPGLHHISRVNSDSNLASQSGVSTPSVTTKDWNAETMSRVPSYQVAMRSPTPDGISPLYIPPEEAELARPKSIHLKSSSLSNSRAHSTALLSNLRGGPEGPTKQKSNSNNTSPSMSRDTSSVYLPHSKHSNTTAKSPPRPNLLSSSSFSFSGSMTPMSSSQEQAPPFLKSTGKSSSFVNLMSHFHKGDKKK